MEWLGLERPLGSTERTLLSPSLTPRAVPNPGPGRSCVDCIAILPGVWFVVRLPPIGEMAFIGVVSRPHRVA